MSVTGCLSRRRSKWQNVIATICTEQNPCAIPPKKWKNALAVEIVTNAHFMLPKDVKTVLYFLVRFVVVMPNWYLSHISQMEWIGLRDAKTHLAVADLPKNTRTKTRQSHFGTGGHKMYIPEFVCGILATIGFEILLLIGYAIVRKK